MFSYFLFIFFHYLTSCYHYRQLSKAVKMRSEESRDQAWVDYARERAGRDTGYALRGNSLTFPTDQFFLGGENMKSI